MQTHLLVSLLIFVVQITLEVCLKFFFKEKVFHAIRLEKKKRPTQANFHASIEKVLIWQQTEGIGYSTEECYDFGNGNQGPFVGDVNMGLSTQSVKLSPTAL